MQSMPKGLAVLSSWAPRAVLACSLCACATERPPPRPPPAPPPPAAAAIATPPPAESAAPPAAPPSLADLIARTLKGIGEAFNAHDGKGVASYYASDAVVSSYGAPDAHGHDEIARAMGGLFGTFADAKSAPLRTWMKGDVVVAETAWTGTMTGDFMGMKATKKPVGQVRARVLWFNDDGLVKEQHEYGDDAGLMAQMTGKKGAPAIPLLPTNPPDIHTANGTADEDKLADWGRALDETFNQDDAKAVLAGEADDAEYWNNISGGPAIHGKTDLGKDLGAFFKAFPDQKWTTIHAWGIDGFSIVEHTMSGTQKGNLGPLRASNKEVKDWHWLDIVQPSADAKVQRGWGYANLVEMMAQTGALKPPSEKAAGSVPSKTSSKN